MKIKVEKGYNLEDAFKGQTVSRAIYDAMNECEVEDSFLIDKAQYVTFFFVKHHNDFSEKHFITRSENKQVRIIRAK